MSAAKEPQVVLQRPDRKSGNLHYELNHFSNVCDFLMMNIFTCHTGINPVSDETYYLITLLMATFHLVFQ